MRAKVKNMLLEYSIKEAEKTIEELTKNLHEARKRNQRLMGEKLGYGDSIRKSMMDLRKDILAMQTRKE
jgi:hypothetical protein